MADIWQIIGKLAPELHRDRVGTIAEAIRQIDSVCDIEQTKHAFGPNLDESQFTGLRSAWLASPETSPKEIAAALVAASRTAETIASVTAVDLVWTGPKTGFIPTRNTEQVFQEVIDSAKSQLFIVSYVFYNAAAIIDALHRAISRGVEVKALFESPIEHGGTVHGNSMTAMADAVAGVHIYVWDSASRDPHNAGLSAAVHAKSAVADGELAFITSANLTSAALERNMELGVLLRGGPTPKSLQSHLEALITTRQIGPWGGQ